MLLAENEVYKNHIMTQEKNIKESENWLEWKEVKKFWRILKRDVYIQGYTTKTKTLKKPAHIHLIQRFVVLSLYVLHPPRRLEYADMKIIKHDKYDKLSDDEKENNNFLIVKSRNKKYFSFGRKAVKSATKQLCFYVRLDTKLNTVMNMWLNYNKNEFLLLNAKNEKLSKNGLTKILKRIFEPKNISVCMLRKIFLSDKFGNETAIKEKAWVADMMNHSISVHQSVYTKH